MAYYEALPQYQAFGAAIPSARPRWKMTTVAGAGMVESALGYQLTPQGWADYLRSHGGEYPPEDTGVKPGLSVVDIQAAQAEAQRAYVAKRDAMGLTGRETVPAPPSADWTDYRDKKRAAARDIHKPPIPVVLHQVPRIQSLRVAASRVSSAVKVAVTRRDGTTVMLSANYGRVR